MELETLPDSFSDVPAESYSDGSFVDGNGDLQNRDGAVDESEVVQETELQTETVSPSELDQEYLFDSVPVDAVVGNDASALASAYMPSDGNMWRVSFDGAEYYAYFPADADLVDLGGQLVNMGSVAVTGLLSADGSVNIDSYNSFYLTLQPLLTSAGNNAAYRYGSRAYRTYYYPGSSSTSLSSSVTYGSVSVVDRPKVGWSFSPFELIVCGLLFFVCLFELVGGIIRK